MRTRILIADDHPLFRLALTQAVTGSAALGPVAVTEAGSLAEALAALATAPDTDLVLLDLHLPDSYGLMGLAALRATYPSVAVLMISAHDDPRTMRLALDYGAAGYVLKRADLKELGRAVETVLACRQYLPPERAAQVTQLKASHEDRALAARLKGLTPQQFRVLQLIAEGKLNKQIADRLAITERTVKAHVSAIFERLGVRNRTQAGVLLRQLDVSDAAQAPIPAG